MEQEALWNPLLGIWQDRAGKAVVKVEKQLAAGEPLYVFGYGSLIWRPGDVLGAFESWEAESVTHGRLFGQYSHDHRGTPVFPGLVCTLQPLSASAPPGSGACGRVWLIPFEEAERVLETLDEREKGGYSRTVIAVRLQGKRTPHYTGGQEFNAVVYLGSPGNPNFFAGATVSEEADGGAGAGAAAHEQAALHRTANIISVAEGPSGRNVDYLLSLSHYLHTVQPSHQAAPAGDPYLRTLSRAVWRRLYSKADCWARSSAQRRSSSGGGSSSSFDAIAAAAHSEEGEEVGSSAALLGLRGWGSNEYAQLDAAPGAAAGPGAYRHAATECADAAIKASDAADCHVLAGGGSSALLFPSRGELRLFGQLCLPAAAPADACDPKRVSLWSVSAAALGHEHLLVLCKDGKVLDVRRDGAALAPPGKVYVPAPSFVTQVQLSEVLVQPAPAATGVTALPPASQVVHAAAGLRHSACVTADGAAYTWGDSRWGQVEVRAEQWQPSGVHYPAAKPHFLRVSCGTRHTTLVSSVGEVFTAGSAKHGALGRGSEAADGLQLVPLDKSTKWTDVRAGWAHSVARGVGPDGLVRFVGWGRSDLGQWAYTGAAPEGSVDAAGNVLLPLPLAPPPTGGRSAWVEVWCGAEHTVACDSQGGLWSTGWDAHGVLGQGPAEAADTADTAEKGVTSAQGGGRWQPVRAASGQQVHVCMQGGVPRVGGVACGGAHCLCLF